MYERFMNSVIKGFGNTIGTLTILSIVYITYTVFTPNIKKRSKYNNTCNSKPDIVIEELGVEDVVEDVEDIDIINVVDLDLKIKTLFEKI
jgi:hypothetical protein